MLIPDESALMDTRQLSSQSILGGILIVIGIVLTAETTDAYDASIFLEYIPLLFVLLGVYALVSSGFRTLFGPVVVIIVAGAWQLVTLEYLDPEQVTQFWPLVIVAVGVSFVLGRYRSRSRTVSDSHLNAIGIFGGSEQRSTTAAFEGADLTALFGGVELDLRDAGIADRPARVSATAMFGGCEIAVPPTWNVRMDVFPIFGGAEDERKRRDSDHDEIDLIVTGFVAFGGLVITD